MFGLALLLLLASAGIVATTVVRRSSATTADQMPTAEPTSFIAIVETPPPTPITPTPSPTARATATPRTAASPATPATGGARTPTATVGAAAVGSGQSRAARGLAGAMAQALGGSLPPAQAAAAVTQPPAPVVVPPAIPPPVAPTATRTPTRVTTGGSTGGGSTAPTATRTPTRVTTGGGSTGGGSTAPTATRTPIPLPPTATATTPAPTATVPVLPPVALPGPGSARHTYNLTYTQNADLSQLPAGSFAYTIEWVRLTQQQVASIASAIGIPGAVQMTGDGFRVSDNAKGTLIVNSTTGQVIYTAPTGTASSPLLVALAETPSPAAGAQATGTAQVPATVGPGPALVASPTVPPSAGPSAAPSSAPSVSPTATPTKPAPSTVPAPLSDAAAIAQARDWLVKAGLWPGGVDAGKVARPTPEQVVVTFHPTQPESALLGDPSITVKLGTTGAVREVFYRWFKNPDPRQTLLRGAAAAWAEAQAGKGYLEVEQTVPTTLPVNTVYRGAATVTKVSIGLHHAVAANGTVYLVPIYIFEGTVKLDNPAPGQTGPFAFRLYIQATP